MFKLFKKATRETSIEVYLNCEPLIKEIGMVDDRLILLDGKIESLLCSRAVEGSQKVMENVIKVPGDLQIIIDEYKIRQSNMNKKQDAVSMDADEARQIAKPLLDKSFEEQMDEAIKVISEAAREGMHRIEVSVTGENVLEERVTHALEDAGYKVSRTDSTFYIGDDRTRYIAYRLEVDWSHTLHATTEEV